MNLTPMLDVVFILVLFFIVMAPFTTEEGIDFYDSTKPWPEEGTGRLCDPVLAVRIYGDNTFALPPWDGPQNPFDIENLYEATRIAALDGCRTNNYAVVFVHPDADIEWTIAVAERIRRAGVGVSLTKFPPWLIDD